MEEDKLKKLSAESLKEAKGILEKCEVPYWLTLGTCLGAYRDGDFCKGDYDDIDIGIHSDYYYKIGEITREFEMAGWHNWHNFIDQDGIAPEHSFLNDKNQEFRNKIDIFFYTKVDKNNMVFRLWKGQRKNTQANPRKCFEDKLGEVIFYGEKYPIPAHIEDYLVCNYGKDWSIPITREHWDYFNDNKSKKI